jgi:hypothetical protein
MGEFVKPSAAVLVIRAFLDPDELVEVVSAVSAAAPRFTASPLVARTPAPRVDEAPEPGFDASFADVCTSSSAIRRREVSKANHTGGPVAV